MAGEPGLASCLIDFLSSSFLDVKLDKVPFLVTLVDWYLLGV